MGLTEAQPLESFLPWGTQLLSAVCPRVSHSAPLGSVPWAASGDKSEAWGGGVRLDDAQLKNLSINHGVQKELHKQRILSINNNNKHL